MTLKRKITAFILIALIVVLTFLYIYYENNEKEEYKGVFIKACSEEGNL